MFSSHVHSKSRTPIIEGAGPCLGGGGGGALGRWRCLLRCPPRDLTPANRAPFGVSAVATTVVMSARRMVSELRERLCCRPVLMVLHSSIDAMLHSGAVAVPTLGALWRYQLALLDMHQLIDDKCKLML